MKKKSCGRFTAVLMAAVLAAPGTAIPAKAAAPEVTLPEPVFALDFENIGQSAGEEITGNITAAGGETVTAHSHVSAAEGRNGGKAVLLDNASGSSGYLSTENTDKLNPSDMTVSVWLNRQSATNNTEGRILWNKETTATDSNCWQSEGWFMGWTNGEAMAFVTDGRNMAVQRGNSDDILP